MPVSYTHLDVYKRQILITGAAGVGKSFLASALGHQACLQGYSVAYYNMQKLMIKLKQHRLEGIIILSLIHIYCPDGGFAVPHEWHGRSGC